MAVAIGPVVAQTYTVYSVVGSAKIVKGKGTSPLTARQQINSATRLMIGPETAVTVLDEKNSRTYYFASEGTHTVGELVEKTRSRAKHVSRQYMSYMVKQLFDSGSTKMSQSENADFRSSSERRPRNCTGSPFAFSRSASSRGPVPQIKSSHPRTFRIASSKTSTPL